MMNPPTVGENYIATKDSEALLDKIRVGELWKVTRVDDDGDVWIELVNKTEMSQEQIGSSTYLDGREFWGIFRIPGRDGEAEALERQITDDEVQVARLMKQIQIKKAQLALLRKYDTDEAEVSAIWDAISSQGDDLSTVMELLGLENQVLEVEPSDE